MTKSSLKANGKRNSMSHQDSLAEAEYEDEEFFD